MKHENALRNWEYHCTEFKKMGKYLSEKSGKPLNQILMRQQSFRHSWEDRAYLEQAILRLETGNANFWTPGQHIGNDFVVGLVETMPKGNLEKLERVFHQEEESFGEIKGEYKKKRLQELKSIMNVIDPYFQV
jgi:hypothetical protein